MIPQTIGSLLLFLGLVAPGIFFERRRERYRTAPSATTFREISGIALASLLLTSTSTATLVFAHKIFGLPFADLQKWTQEGAQYFSDNFYIVVVNIAAEVALALGIAWGVDTLLRRYRKGKGNLSPHSLWHQAFRVDLPEGAIPWVHVKLMDGSSFYGKLRGSSAGSAVDEREICLDGPKLSYRPNTSDGNTQLLASEIGDRWEYVIIRSSEVRYLRIQYLDKTTGAKVPSDRRRRETEISGAPITSPTSAEVKTIKLSIIDKWKARHHGKNAPKQRQVLDQ